MPLIRGIVAVNEDNAMGLANGLPWHCPEELEHFKQATSGHAIVVGHKTYEGLPRLKQRLIVIPDHSTDPPPNDPWVHHIHPELLAGLLGKLDTLEWYLKTANNQIDTSIVYIAGGLKTYETYAPFIQDWVVSVIPGKHKADVYFNSALLDSFRVSDALHVTNSNGLVFTRYHYSKNNV